eukprot:5801990-Pyramimonas_sp.AAC.1
MHRHDHHRRPQRCVIPPSSRSDGLQPVADRVERLAGPHTPHEPAGDRDHIWPRPGPRGARKSVAL